MDKDLFQENLHAVTGRVEEAKSRYVQDENYKGEIQSLKKQIGKLEKNEQVLVKELIKQTELCKNSLKIAHIQEKKYSDDCIIKIENDCKKKLEEYRLKLMEQEDLIAELTKENKCKLYNCL